jgi:tripartite-type tricarboxylate transporter receptor subunit TctC
MKFAVVLAVAAVSLAALSQSHAQSYPSKTIRLISPYPPGGGTDAAARIIAQALGDQLGQQVIVDTRGGASGMIGTELASRAAK